MEYPDGIESTSIGLTGVEVTDHPHLAHSIFPPLIPDCTLHRAHQ